MRLIGIMPVRNEAWVLGLSARAALMWCDQLLVLNHASTDETVDICLDLRSEYGERFGYLSESDPTWAEMDHRQRLLVAARQRGATHIAVIDADEVLTGSLLPHIREHVERTPPERILQMPWLCLRDGIQCYMNTGLWGQATVSVAFKDDPAFHWAATNDGYHFHHRHPLGKDFIAHTPHWIPSETIAFLPSSRTRFDGLMHLQFCSRRRLLAKQALYQAIEVTRWPNRKPVSQVREMYARTVCEAAAAIVRPVPTGWWEPYQSLLQYLDVDAVPWQEAELRRLVAEHGNFKFSGLDFFGVV
jgi:hypothetical protein